MQLYKIVQHFLANIIQLVLDQPTLSSLFSDIELILTIEILKFVDFEY